MILQKLKLKPPKRLIINPFYDDVMQGVFSIFFSFLLYFSL